MSAVQGSLLAPDQPDAATAPPAPAATGGDIPGALDRDRQRKSDLRWLTKADNWGEWHVPPAAGGEGPPLSTWMYVGRGGRVRFYARGIGQVGPEHAHLVAATAWAFYEAWVDPDCPALSAKGHEQVVAESRLKGDPEPDAWRPIADGDVAAGPAIELRWGPYTQSWVEIVHEEVS